MEIVKTKNYAPVARFTRIVLDVGIIVIILSLGFSYLILMFTKFPVAFLEMSTPLFLGLTTFCGLSLGYAGVISSINKRKAIYVSELFIFSTILFSLTILSIILINGIHVDIRDSAFGIIIKWILKIFGSLFLIFSMLSAYIGLAELSNLIWNRWVKHLDKENNESIHNDIQVNSNKEGDIFSDKTMNMKELQKVNNLAD
jgi:hypothetical protein